MKGLPYSHCMCHWFRLAVKLDANPVTVPSSSALWHLVGNMEPDTSQYVSSSCASSRFRPISINGRRKTCEAADRGWQGDQVWFYSLSGMGGDKCEREWVGWTHVILLGVQRRTQWYQELHCPPSTNNWWCKGQNSSGFCSVWEPWCFHSRFDGSVSWIIQD